MKMNPVSSSQIEAMGYDPETKTCAIKFVKGGEYHYANVEQEDFDAIFTAKSVGSAFYKSALKNNPAKHPFTRQPAVKTPPPAV